MANRYTNTRYTSGKQVSAKIGITSHSENITSLEVIGRVGVGTTQAVTNLHVQGDTHVSGNIGIGTTIPTNGASLSNTSVLNVGIVTANEYYGAGLGLTGITSATNATNIYGGQSGQLLYQANPGVTSAFESGSTGFGLFSRGPGQPPQWLAAAPSGAIEGVTVFDNGALVGSAGSFGALNFVGLQVNAIGVVTSGEVGVATIFVREQPTVGIATNVIGGIASVTSLDVNQPNGISTIGQFEVASEHGIGATVGAGNHTGIITYYGDGTFLSGIVTQITAGANISISPVDGKGNVTVTGLANTANIVADTLVVTGVTTLSDTSITSATIDNLVVTGVTTLSDTSIDNLVVTGVTTLSDTSITSTTIDNLVVTGVTTLSDTSIDNLVVTGVTTLSDTSIDNLVVTGVTTLSDTSITSTTIDNLVVTGVTTLGVVTNTASIGVVTAYITEIVGTSASFSGNVTIGGTLTYEDVTNIDAVGFVTARQGINVGHDYDGGTGVGVTILSTGNAVFSGIVTTNNLNVETNLGVGTDNPLNTLQVGLGNSSVTVVSTATTTLLGVGTTDPQYTLDVRGDTNIDGNLTINTNTVPTLAMVIALGGL